MDLEPAQVAIIGDRIFTDILAGNRLGLHTVLVKKIGIDGEPLIKNNMQAIEKAIVKILGVKYLWAFGS